MTEVRWFGPNAGVGGRLVDRRARLVTMEPDGTGTRDEIRLPFEPGDRFVQVHANGAILVVADDYRWNLATLGQAVAVALEAQEDGTRILVGHEVLDDRTVAALESIRRTGATVVDFGTVIPPMTWPAGTTPLMTAATQGRNDLVEDLLVRGIPADRTDDAGTSALHHAAYAGNEGACDLLVAAGLDPAATDGDGHDAGDYARSGGHHQLATRLSARSAAPVGSPTEAAGGTADFGWRGPAKLVSLWVGVIGIPVTFLALALQWANLWSLGLVAFVVGVLWTQGHLLRAGAPRRLRDGALEVRRLAGTARLPLADVRGVLLIPPRGVNGAPFQLVLCQDRLGRPSTAARLHALSPGLVPHDDAERFAALAQRHLVVVLGRGRHTDRILQALAPALDRLDVPSNRWWQEVTRSLS